MLDAIDRVICDVGQNGAKVQFWIEAVEPWRSRPESNGSGQVASGVGRQFIVPEFWYVPAQQLMRALPGKYPWKLSNQSSSRLGVQDVIARSRSKCFSITKTRLSSCPASDGGCIMKDDPYTLSYST